MGQGLAWTAAQEKLAASQEKKREVQVVHKFNKLLTGNPVAIGNVVRGG